jgi:hypothetical protein
MYRDDESLKPMIQTFNMSQQQFLNLKIIIMKKILLVPFMLSLLFVILTSCQKVIPPANNMVRLNSSYGVNLKSKSKLEVENGIIVFKNLEQYLKTIKLLSHYNNDEIDGWVKSVGFESYNKKADEAIDNLDKVNSENELNIVMKKFQDFLTIRHRNGENFYECTVFPNPNTNVANKDGLYIIGKTAYRILGEYKLKINRENINKLLYVHYPDIKSNKIPADIKLIKYGRLFTFMPKEKRKSIINTDFTSDNNTSTNDVHSIYKTNQTSNRKVGLQVVAYWDSQQNYNYVSYYAYIDAAGYKKMWWKLGGWGQYKTEINIEGTNVDEDDFIIRTPWGTKSYDIPHMKSTEDCKSMMLHEFNDIWYSYPGPEMYIISAHVKAWTRGTTSNVFALINYDF